MDNKLIIWSLIECLCVTCPLISRGAAQTNAVIPTSQASIPHMMSVNPVLSTNKVALTGASKSIPTYQLYTYYGDRYRDPFIPLEGTEAHLDLSSDRPPQISSLQLKGIIQDLKGRIALLSSGVSSYILRAGRLYDGRNHMMKGISGVIKSNSVILIGSDHTVRELKVSATL